MNAENEALIKQAERKIQFFQRIADGRSETDIILTDLITALRRSEARTEALEHAIRYGQSHHFAAGSL